MKLQHRTAHPGIRITPRLRLLPAIDVLPRNSAAHQVRLEVEAADAAVLDWGILMFPAMAQAGDSDMGLLEAFVKGD